MNSGIAVRGTPCVFDGVQLRSKVEKQWCSFFNYLGIRWDYEHKRYPLPGGESYLPDFWLPQLRRFVEIKGRIDQDNIWKAQAFQAMMDPVCPMDIFIMRVESQDRKYLRLIFPGDVDSAVTAVRAMPKGNPCYECDETGEIPCGSCHGAGFWACDRHDDSPNCHGGPCGSCSGSGTWTHAYCDGRGGFGQLYGQGSRWNR